MVSKKEHFQNYKENTEFSDLISKKIGLKRNSLEDEISISKSNKINSFSKNKTNPEYIEKFLNSSFEIIDFRECYEVINRPDYSSRLWVVKEEKLNVKFDYDNNTIYLEKPKSEGQILNAIHSIEIYYDLMIPNEIQSGKIKGDSILDLNGNLQETKSPIIKFKDKIKASKKVYLDHPERVNAMMPTGNLEGLEEISNFKNFNKGTNFVFINHRVKTLEGLLEDYSKFCRNKILPIMKISKIKEGKNLKDFDYLWYFKSLTTEQNLKIFKKFEKMYDLVYGNDVFEPSDEFKKIIELNSRKIDSEESFKDFLNETYAKFHESEREIEEFSDERNEKWENLLLGYYRDELKNKDVYEENRIKEDVFIKLIDFFGSKKFNVGSYWEDVDINLKKVGLNSCLKGKYPLFEKSKEEIIKENFDNFRNLSSIEENMEYLKDVESSIECTEYEKKFVKKTKIELSLCRNISSKYKKKIRKIMLEGILERNKEYKEMDFSFTKEEILEVFREETHFILPIFIYYKKEKEFNHLNRLLNNFSVPSQQTENSTIIYDPLKGMDKQIIPLRIRNEFNIHAYHKGLKVFKTKYNRVKTAKIEKLIK